MEFTQHPLSAAFPAMDEADYQALKDDIEDQGQREPIIVLDGMVLDGWHRYRACMELDVEPTQFKFGGDDPVAFVKSENLHRRHLTASQRTAAIVACLAWRPPGRRKINSEVTSYLNDSNSQPAIAKAAGVTVRTVSQVQAAQKAGLLEPVRDGALTAEEAAKIARGNATKPKQQEQKRKVAPPPGPDPEMLAQLDDVKQAVTVLSDENDRLNDQLAINAMVGTAEEKRAATETIAELRAKVKTLEAELKAVKASRDGYMQENAQLKRQCVMQRKQLEKVPS